LAVPRAFRLVALIAGLLIVAAAGPRAAAVDRAPQLAAYARQRFRAGDFATALALRRRLLAMAIHGSGSASPPAAAAMAELASLYIEMQRYLDAEPLLIAARNGLLAANGPRDPALVPVLCGLARVARAYGEVREAQEWAAEAVALAAGTRRGRPYYGEALRAFGGALAAARHFAESEQALRRALALDQEIDGGAGSRAARDLAMLGAAYVRQQRYAEALPLIEQAALIDETRLGPTHPFIADDFHELGLAYLGLQRRSAAAAALRFAIWVLVRGAGNGTARLAYTELTLARVLHEQGHADKAERLFAFAHKILGKAEKEERRRQDWA
jgi:tetratricopeptide (TPR) repeat protein